MLPTLVADPAHVYLPDMPSPAAKESGAAFERLLGHQLVTDSILLLVAQSAVAVLLTFDRRLAGMAESGGQVQVLD